MTRPVRRNSIRSLRVRLLLLVLRATAAIAAATVWAPQATAAATGSDPNGIAIHLGPATTVYDPASASEIASFPGAFSVDRIDALGQTLKTLFVNYSQNEDSASAPLKNAYRVSTDAGASFTGPVRESVGLMNVVQQLSGEWLDIGFRNGAIAGSTVGVVAHRSTDEGRTWTRFPSTLDVSPFAIKSGHGVLFHRGILQIIENGAPVLLVPFYTAYPADPGTAKRVELAQSLDGGRTWTRRGTIVASSTQSTYWETYNEAAIVQLKNGSLYAVVRNERIDRSTRAVSLDNLVYSMSSDGGRTWAGNRTLLVSGAATLGVDPALLLMPNGLHVLTFGRPDNWVAVSEDDGVNWTYKSRVYVNRSAQFWAHGSSGYTGIAALGSNRAVVTYDNCAASWGCPAGDSGWTVDDQYRVGLRYIDVLGRNVGKIDLAHKHRLGLVRVTTNLDWTSAAHPGARPAGAFDGSTEYWSSAMAADRGAETPQMTIELDQLYRLNRVGLSLQRGFAAGAAVYLSEDGVAWGAPAWNIPAGTIRHAVAYLNLPAPRLARFVKVVGTPSPLCAADIGPRCFALNEIELFSTRDSFENDPFGIPRGFHNVVSSWTTAYEVNGTSTRALRITDRSPTQIATVTWTGAASAQKTLELRFRSVVTPMPSAFLITVRGRNASQAVVTGYHLLVNPDGALHRYDFARATWSAVTRAGAVPVDRWSTLRFEITPGGAAFYVDGSLEASSIPQSSSGAATFHEYSLSSSGTVPATGEFLVDDVLFE